jgi:hypothetical protein
MRQHKPESSAMSNKQLEERLRLLEQEVAELRSRLDEAAPLDWRKMVGLFRGDAAMREIVERGAEIRRSERSVE